MRRTPASQTIQHRTIHKPRSKSPPDHNTGSSIATFTTVVKLIITNGISEPTIKRHTDVTYRHTKSAQACINRKRYNADRSG